MAIDPEKLANGRAIISRKLGGAVIPPSLDSLVQALSEAFALERSKPAEAWPDYVAEALGFMDSALEAGATARVQADAARRERDAAKAALREAERAEVARNEELEEAREALRLHSAELGKARLEITDLQRSRDRAQARANNAETRHTAALADSLVLAAESDERGELLADLARVLAGLPLAILASADQAGELARLYLRAELLTAEPPAERHARLRSKLEGKPANG